MEQVIPDSTPLPSRRNLFAGLLCMSFITSVGITDESLSDLALARLEQAISNMAAIADALGSEYSRLERDCFQCAAPTDIMKAQVVRAEAAHDRAERALADALDLFACIRADTVGGLILKAKWASRSSPVADSIVTDLVSMGASGEAISREPIKFQPN